MNDTEVKFHVQFTSLLDISSGLDGLIDKDEPDLSCTRDWFFVSKLPG